MRCKQVDDINTRLEVCNQFISVLNRYMERIELDREIVKEKLEAAPASCLTLTLTLLPRTHSATPPPQSTVGQTMGARGSKM